ncbi:hypothetical protein C8R43DRAFT_1111960 [Mycena crocata]|nr:hypothetical protein C8R43DRAFT_1111960 [Mycena crocata]
MSEVPTEVLPPSTPTSPSSTLVARSSPVSDESLTPESSPTVLPATHIVAALAVHQQLSKLANETMFDVDYAWAVYAETGSVEETHEVLVRMAKAADERLARTISAFAQHDSSEV